MSLVLSFACEVIDLNFVLCLDFDIKVSLGISARGRDGGDLHRFCMKSTKNVFFIIDVCELPLWLSGIAMGSSINN